MNKKISSNAVLGILGSGQLARMTCIAASEFGIITSVYCSDTLESPASHVASKTFKGKIDDKESILKFCEACDIVTLENEFINQDILEAIEENFPEKLYPSAKTLKKIGDKISEKESFKNAGIKIVPYAIVNSYNDVKDFITHYGLPVVLKSSKGGYDGYGNITIHSIDEIEEKYHQLKGELLVEAFIPYEKELAIIVARNQKGEEIFYPIAHTIQENHICHFVSVPALIPESIESKIRTEALKAMRAIDAVGIFAFEFFLTHNGDLYLNESAPRPHNSGHYTIEGCQTSQFQNHIRSIFNLPLGATQLRTPCVLMLNLLGTKDAIAELHPIDHFLRIDDGHLHLYGKKNSRIGRKMGHFTLLGNDSLEMQKILKQLKMEYSL